ncbi:unnamed protein product, partial [Tetraodon nigroviridis]
QSKHQKHQAFEAELHLTQTASAGSSTRQRPDPERSLRWQRGRRQGRSRWSPGVSPRWSPGGLQVVSWWSPGGLLVVSRWSPGGLLVVSGWSPGGLQVASRWSPGGLMSGLPGLMTRLAALDEQWQFLFNKSAEKSQIAERGQQAAVLQHGHQGL